MRKNTKLMKKLRKNKNAGIEGLPMQLLVIIVIATLGMGLMVGWMNNIQEPQHIGDVDVLSGNATVKEKYGKQETSRITVLVTDQSGNPLEGATVAVTGLGAKYMGKTPCKTTDADGMVNFEKIDVTMNGKVGYLTLNISKPGYGESNSCKITVVR